MPVKAPPAPEFAAPARPVEASALPAAPLAARPAPAPDLPLPDPPPAARGADAGVWSVDGRVLTKSDLGDFVLRYAPERASEALAQLLDEAVIDAEAARESVSVDARTVAERTDAYLDAQRKEARIQYGPSADLDKVLRERWGRDVAALRTDAERLVRAVCLRDRLVRLDQFREDGVEVRVLVLPAEDAARDAAARLRDGADMTLYARSAGLRPPASPPPFARGEIPEKGVESRLFAAASGEVLDPVPFDVAGKGRFWQVYKVTRSWSGSAEPWAALRTRVEESIAAAPVTDDECARWRRRAYARHRIDVCDAAKGWVQPPGGQ